MVVRQRPARAKQPVNWRSAAIFGIFGLVVALSGFWMAQHWITYKGVPLNIILQFLQDPIAREAYFAGDKKGLHNRLDQMGVEEQIKAFYRPRIPDEVELDRYIHQLLYENTGYVGDAYILDQGKLLPKPTLSKEFRRWFNLAKRLDLVQSTDIENGVVYVTTPQGTRVSYDVIASLYTIEDLRKLIALKRPRKAE